MLSPFLLQKQLPLRAKQEETLASMRSTVKNILLGADPRIPIVLGPCSIHSVEGALLYAEKLAKLQEEVKESFYLVMRVYVEKARTTLGWKGLLYDPFLDGTNAIESGLFLSRKLLLSLLDLGVPTAMEFVNPLTASYLKDLITWGFIGARTSSSQCHREIASSLAFPVGFKNSIDGNVETAIQGIIASREAQNFLGIDKDGQIASLTSLGNPYSHLVLRGSTTTPNYDRKSVQKAINLQNEMGIHSRVLIDCAHGNSQKNPLQQKAVFKDVMEQIEEGESSILGFMLESFLEHGKQLFTLGDETSPSLSITDPCLNFEETRLLLLENRLLMKIDLPLFLENGR